jgi:group I intron endonuclease
MKYLSNDNNKGYCSGIYKIESTEGKIYIGSATSLKTRYFTHRNCLLKNKHDNSRLQNYMNKYGIESLNFIVLEYCGKDFLINREQFYIDTLNPFFNIAKIAGATYGLKPWLNKKHSEETKLKIKQSNLITFSKKPKAPKKEIPIRLTKEENIKRFSLINKTEKRRKEISERQKGNKNWLGKKHKKETIENRTGDKNPNSKVVKIIELNIEFSTLKECANYLGVSSSSICNSIVRNNKVKSQFTICRK